MSSHKPEQYRAYAAATGTVAKTRQVVMLYDGAITCLRRGEIAIREGRIEERFNQLVKASEILMALQSSIDFDNGGEIATILHDFYTHVSRRIISVNFLKDQEKSGQMCLDLIEELKQMRTVWDDIDRSLTHVAPPQAATSKPHSPSEPQQPTKPLSQGGSGIIISA